MPQLPNRRKPEQALVAPTTDFAFTFKNACIQGNLDFVKELLNDPNDIKSFDNMQIIYQGLEEAAMGSHVHILKYVLEEHPLNIKNQPEAYDLLNQNLLSYMCSYTSRNHSTTSLEYFISYLEATPIDLRPVLPFNLSLALIFKNIPALHFLIGHYNLTGQEEFIKPILIKQSRRINQDTKDLLMVNFEKQILKDIIYGRETVEPSKEMERIERVEEILKKTRQPRKI